MRAISGLPCAIFALLASRICADLLPPGGVRPVPYEIEVDGLSEAGSHALAIFPWSFSSGRPMTGVTFAKPGQPVRFGRRISGEPAFWAVPRAKVQEVQSLPDEGLDAWFAHEENAQRCSGAAITPEYKPRKRGATSNVDSFYVAHLGSGGCEVRPGHEAAAAALLQEGPSPGQPSGWASPSFTAALSLLGVFAVVVRLYAYVGAKTRNKQ